LSVRLSATAPLGFIAHSFAGDDFGTCRDYIAGRLGLSRDAWKDERRPSEPRRGPPEERPADEDREKKVAIALALWAAATDPRGTPTDAYLRGRGLELGDDIAGEVLRWHPGAGALLALFRNIHTDEPQAVSRTILDREGRKLKRMFAGPVGGAAIKLDPDEDVLGGLHIGEGVETCLAARALGLRPTWALGSAGAVAAFPILSGIECLTVIADHDEKSGAGEKAARAVEECWLSAGREVRVFMPAEPGDLNDVLKGAA
jgi:hypothetical protein